MLVFGVSRRGDALADDDDAALGGEEALAGAVPAAVVALALEVTGFSDDGVHASATSGEIATTRSGRSMPAS